MESDTYWRISFAFILIFLNGYFVSAEFSILKIRRSQIKLLIEGGNHKAKKLLKAIDDLDAYLSATQLGITIASLALGWVSQGSFYVLFNKIFSNLEFAISAATVQTISITVSFLFITILHIVIGELVPKSLAIRNAEKIALSIISPLILFYNIFRPFIYFMNLISDLSLKLFKIKSNQLDDTHSTKEIQILLRQSAEKGDIEEDNYEIVKNALGFQEHTVKQIMIPRQNVVSIDIMDDKDKIIKQVLNCAYSRIPVYKDSIDNIIGVFYTKEFLKALINSNGNKDDLNFDNLIHDALYVVESKYVDEVLKLFKDKKQLIAIVIDEFGGTEGIITLEDILEEIVGEIQDEKDNEEAIVNKISEAVFIIESTEPLDEINQFLPQPIEENPECYNTLAGYILYELDEIPSQGQKFSIENYNFEILEMLNKSVEKVKVTYIKDNKVEK